MVSLSIDTPLYKERRRREGNYSRAVCVCVCVCVCECVLGCEDTSWGEATEVPFWGWGREKPSVSAH